MTFAPLLANVAARWAVTRTPTCGWVPDESETEMAKTPEWDTVGNGCECWVNPNPWTYYGIPEPGDCIEYNPYCPEHGEEATA